MPRRSARVVQCCAFDSMRGPCSQVEPEGWSTLCKHVDPQQALEIHNYYGADALIRLEVL
jgi:hypothetical protein